MRARRRLALTVCLYAAPTAGCREDPPAPRIEIVEPDGAGTRSSVSVFRGGLEVSGVRVEPPEPVPGESLEVSWGARGFEDARVRVGVLSPRVAARQEILARERPTRAPDPREVWGEANASDGSITLTLPAPWHPVTATVVMEVIDGHATVPAIEGPRTASGRALLAAVPVTMRPTAVTARRVATPPTIDGKLDEWSGEGTALVLSVQGEPFARRQTRVQFAWDSRALYVAAELPDGDIHTKYERHDDPLYKGEVFELFIAASGEGRDYLEYQVSARNVTFDAHFPRYRKGDETWDSQWQTAVSVRGTLDDRNDRDEGWSVEAAVPWTEVCERAKLRCPPREGQTLRVNTFRLEHPKDGPAYGLALSPTRSPDFHAWHNAAELTLEP